MKTYIINKIEQYKRLSATLDELTEVKNQLCNRTWCVFNDGDEKEVYKFREDGTIIISLNGRVTKGTWEFDPADKTLIITAAEQSLMVHVATYEDLLLALQVDGTKECAFLMEEEKKASFEPQSYSALLGWFDSIERKRIEAEARARQEAERQYYLAQQARQAEQQRRKENRRRQKLEQECVQEFHAYLKERGYKPKYTPQIWRAAILVVCTLALWLIFFIPVEDPNWLLMIVPLLMILFVTIMTILYIRGEQMWGWEREYYNGLKESSRLEFRHFWHEFQNDPQKQKKYDAVILKSLEKQVEKIR